MNLKSLFFVITTSGFLLLISCTPIKSYKAKPAKKAAFSGDKDLVDSDVLAYHLNDSVTMIYYRIATDNLMQKKIDTTQIFYTNLSIGCKLLTDINGRTIIDSASVSALNKAPDLNESKFIEGNFRLKMKQMPFAYLDFWITDRNKNVEYTNPIIINKKNESVEQNYLIYSNKKVAFKNTFYSGENVSIESNRNRQKTIYVDCFFKDFAIALPPFSTQKPDELKYKPDSAFTINLDQSINITMPSKGFYHLKANPSGFDGLSLHTFEKSYPGVNNVDEMINCTRYIMRSEEFEACKKSDNQKLAIDNFWLGLAGSNERAKELLRKYYGRVKEANKRYTSYTQGWKTDRGMIYIIFGEPDNNYKSKNDEIWFYGPESDINSVKFVFKKTDNPFSNNDFILIRSHIFQPLWYDFVDNWRQGRVSSEK